MLGNSVQIIIFPLIAFSCLIGYVTAGFYGVALVGIGILTSSVTVCSIYFLSTHSRDSFNLAVLVDFYGELKDLLYKISWAARNYAIFV